MLKDLAALLELRGRAREGDADAQFQLGIRYATGPEGVPQDDTESVRWYRKAAEQGHSEAQVHLGMAHAVGQGVPQDYVEALKWLTIAASAGGDMCSLDGYVGDAHKKSGQRAKFLAEFIAESITAVQFIEAQRRAREWKPKTTQK